MAHIGFEYDYDCGTSIVYDRNAVRRLVFFALFQGWGLIVFASVDSKFSSFERLYVCCYFQSRITIFVDVVKIGSEVSC